MNSLKGNLKVRNYAAEATAADGGASPIIDLTTEKLAGVQNGTGTTAMTFYGSADNVSANFGILFINGATTLTSTMVNNQYFAFNPDNFKGVRYLKICVATTPRTLKVITEVL